MSLSKNGRMNYEDGSGKVEYNAFNNENYSTLNNINPPQIIGGIGETCKSNSGCNSKLYCYQSSNDNTGICSEWSPFNIPYSNKVIMVSRPQSSLNTLCTYKEDCNGNSVCVNNTCQYHSKEGFNGSFQDYKLMLPGTPDRPSSQINQSLYSSKFKSNSGKKYY